MLGYNKLSLIILNVCIREGKSGEKMPVNSKDSKDKFEGLWVMYCVKSISQKYLCVY